MSKNCALALLIGFVVGLGLKVGLQRRREQIRHDCEDDRLAQWADSECEHDPHFDPEAHVW